MTLPLSPVIQTERLILRPPVEADWPAYRAYRRSSRSTVAPATGADDMSWMLFAAFFGHWTLRGFGRFIITLRDDGRAIGHCGPLLPEGHPEPELTWTLWDGACEGRGLAFEAASAARDHAFATLGWTTAVSYIDPANQRSIALAHRLGARRDEHAHAPYAGVHVYRHPAPEARP
jgi:RimJ/RimL family protein N-acetyltransferase